MTAMGRAPLEDNGVSLDASTVTALKDWFASDPRQHLAVRVKIEPGGCSGLRYEVSLDDTRTPDDLVFSCAEIDVICDPVAEPHLRGATIHYSETGFSVRNPN